MSTERSRDAGRGKGRLGSARALQDRMRIAQLAARLIAEHGLTDWTAAKRKAQRQLMLPDSAALPSNDELTDALQAHHALFDSAAHAQSLHAQRAEALVWMKRLAQWAPLLVGGVAAGWATRHSAVRVELVADDPKSVEIVLAGAGVRYAALPLRDDGDDGRAAHLLIETPRADVRLTIISEQQRRNRPRHDDEPHLDATAVESLLAAP
jgi:hypothetical protein